MEGLFFENVNNIVFFFLPILSNLFSLRECGGWDLSSAAILHNVFFLALFFLLLFLLGNKFPSSLSFHHNHFLIERKREEEGKEGGKGTDFIWGGTLCCLSFVWYRSPSLPLSFQFTPRSKSPPPLFSPSPFKQGKKAGGWVGRDLIPSLSSNSGQCPPLSASLSVQSAFTNM